MPTRESSPGLRCEAVNLFLADGEAASAWRARSRPRAQRSAICAQVSRARAPRSRRSWSPASRTRRSRLPRTSSLPTSSWWEPTGGPVSGGSSSAAWRSESSGSRRSTSWWPAAREPAGAASSASWWRPTSRRRRCARSTAPWSWWRRGARSTSSTARSSCRSGPRASAGRLTAPGSRRAGAPSWLRRAGVTMARPRPPGSCAPGWRGVRFHAVRGRSRRSRVFSSRVSSM
jgi:hypothetical protein